MLRSTHTFALLEISASAYREIAELLRAAGYHHVFDDEGVIDMHGIGLQIQPRSHASPPQETSMIRPTIGRRVWFWPGPYTTGIVTAKNQPFDAGVAFVHNERMLNISYVDHIGQQYGTCSVPLLQEGDERPAEGGFCEWMPFQAAQAKKLEAENRLDTAAAG